MSNFLGVGFKFPFSVGSNGGIQLSKYENNIEESVRIIIGTALGERQMRPEWGCRIHDFVFAPNNTSTQTLVGRALCTDRRFGAAGMRTVGNAVRVVRDASEFDALATHELTRGVIQDLVRVDVAVVIRRGHRLRIEVVWPRAE